MKTKATIIALACIATFGLANAQNQVQNKKESSKNNRNRTEYVDTNKNGVCDNFENGTPRNAEANGKKALRNGSGKKQKGNNCVGNSRKGQKSRKNNKRS